MTLRQSFHALTITAAVSCLVSVAGSKAEAQSLGGCMLEPPTVQQLHSASSMSMRLRNYLGAPRKIPIPSLDQLESERFDA